MASSFVPTVQVIGQVDEQQNTPLDLPAATFASTYVSRDLAPPSSRSSFTRVEHDDEPRPAQITSHDAINPLSTHILSPIASSSSIDDQTIPLVIKSSQEQEQKAPVETPPSPELSMDQHVPQMPQTYLTFLLISGKRRTMAFEPDTSIGRVKELVWNSWPADWQDDRPPAPSYLRVLYLGRMLQDDETLSKLKLPTHVVQQPTPSSPSSPGPTPTIVHLSVRPYPPPGESDAIKKKKKRVSEGPAGNNDSNDQNDDAVCCRCIIC